MILRNFIVFEGIDGAGTTTQARLLKERLSSQLTLTAEPTKGEIGKFLRRILGGDISFDARTLSYLFAADRAEHLYGGGGIVSTARSTAVLSDRYLFSSLVYQGSEYPEITRLLNSPFPLPEVLFYFRISGECAFRRVTGRGGKKEIFEKRDTLCALSAKYDEVIAEYDGTAKGEGMKVITLDAEQSREDVARAIEKHLMSLRFLPFIACEPPSQ